MKRRQLLFGIVAAGAGFPGFAQQAAKAPLIGVLDATDRPQMWDAFRQRLRELGYVERQNVTIEARFAKGRLELLPTLADELARKNVSLVVTGTMAAAMAMRAASNQIPIVTATGTDHVGLGLADSLAHPGGTVTGVTSLSSDLTAKRLELLREVLPSLSRLAVLWHRVNVASLPTVRYLQESTETSKIAFQNLGIYRVDELSDAFANAAKGRAEAMFVITGAPILQERRKIAELALRYRLPTVFGASEYVEAGGLVSYAPHYAELFRQAAVYADKILKGAKPSDLPIEQPSKFELVVNLKTAKALGVTIPRTVLLRADRIIE